MHSKLTKQETYDCFIRMNIVLTWPAMFICEKNGYGQQEYLYLVATDNYNVPNFSCNYSLYVMVNCGKLWSTAFIYEPQCMISNNVAFRHV